VIIRPATIEDYQQFYGHKPKLTFRGSVAVEAEKIIGIGGFYFQGKLVVVFTDTKPELRKNKKQMMVCLKHMLKMLKECEMPIYAVASRKEPGSLDLLSKAGFQKLFDSEHGPVMQWGKN
jgi:hypothetical protein